MWLSFLYSERFGITPLKNRVVRRATHWPHPHSAVESSFVSDVIAPLYEVQYSQSLVLASLFTLTATMEVDFITKLRSFSKLDFQGKQDVIKNGRPTPELRKLIQEIGQNIIWLFHSEWYNRKDWLCGMGGNKQNNVSSLLAGLDMSNRENIIARSPVIKTAFQGKEIWLLHLPAVALTWV